MRLYEFMVEAPGDELKKKYAALVASLQLEPGEDEGFFGRNMRNNRNNAKLAEFARENDLPGLFNPETGRFVKYGEDPEGGGLSDQVDDAAIASMDDLESLAKIGAIPAAVQDELNQEIEYYDSGERSFSRRDIISNILGNPNPEYRDRLLAISKQNANATGAKVSGTSVDTKKLPGPKFDTKKLPGNQDELDAPGAGKTDSQSPEKTEPKAKQDKSKFDQSKLPGRQPAASKKEPQPGDPNYPYKPGDYTGPDGIEDMSTGKIVKPDSEPAVSKKDSKPAVSKKDSKPAAAAARSKVSYNDLAKASGIADPNKIRVGQEIKLPGGGTYKVKKGDTLSGIAKNYNSGSIGQPAPAAQPAAAPAAPAAPPAPPAPQIRVPAPQIRVPAPQIRVPAPGGDAAPAGAPTPTGGNQPPGRGPDGKPIGGGTSKPTKPGPTPPKKDDEPSFWQRVKQRFGQMFDDVENTTMVESAIKMYTEGKVSRDFVVKVIKESKKMQGKH